MGESATSTRGEDRKKEEKKRKGKGKSNLSRKVSYLESSLSHVAVGAITCYCNWTNASGLIHSLSEFIQSPLSLAAFTVVTFMYVLSPSLSPSNKS